VSEYFFKKSNRRHRLSLHSPGDKTPTEYKQNTNLNFILGQPLVQGGMGGIGTGNIDMTKRVTKRLQMLILLFPQGIMIVAQWPLYRGCFCCC
jgi:hypothetical protein